MSAVYNSTVQGFYLSYYGRPADPAGLTFWTGQLAAAGGNLSSILNAFGTSAEATRRYGTGTTESKIQAVYQQTFGRAADAAGLAFYNTEITAGRITLIDMSKRIIDGATGDDVSIRNNRLSAAQSFTDKLDTDAEKAGYSGSGAEDSARAWIATVTKDAATVTAAVATADATITSLLPQTFTLTTGTDKFTGSSGNDTFSGGPNALASADTLQAIDQIDGGAGADVFNLSISKDFSGFTVGTGFLKNVETVNITNGALSTAYAFSNRGVTGVETYNVSGPVNLSGLSSTTPVVNFSNLAGTAAANRNMSVGFDQEAVAGTADKFTIGLNAVGTAPLTSTGQPQGWVALTTTGVENLTLSVTGTSYASLATGTGSVKNLTVTGTGNLRLATDTAAQGVSDLLSTVDASALKGTIDIDFGAATGVTSIKGSEGANTFRILQDNNADLTGNATIQGGAGANTLRISTADAAQTTAFKMSNIQTVRLDSVAQDLTFSVGNATTPVSKIIVGNTAAVKTTTFAGLGSGDLAIDIVAAGTGGAHTLVADNTGTTAIAATVSSTATASSRETLTDNITLSKSTGFTVTSPNTANYDGNVTATLATSGTLSIAGGATSTIYGPALTSLTINQTSKTVNPALTVGTAAASPTASKLQTLTLNLASTPTIRSASATEDLVITTLNATTELAVDLSANIRDVGNANSLSKINAMTLGGTISTAALTLGNVGGNALAYGITLNSSGLQGKSSAGADQADTGLTIGTITSGPSQVITLNIGDNDGDTVIGNIAIGSGDAANGSVIINAKNHGDTSADTLKLGTLAASTVTVDVGGATGAVTIGAITGRAVSVKASDAASTVVVGNASTGSTDITARNTLTFEGPSLGATTLETSIASGSTTFTANLTGGALADTHVITSASSTQESITVTGDLGVGASNSITITSTTTGAPSGTVLGQTVNVSGLSNSGGATITTGSGRDTITGTAAADTVIAGSGADTVTLGAGNDTFTLNGPLDTGIITNNTGATVNGIANAAGLAVTRGSTPGITFVSGYTPTGGDVVSTSNFDKVLDFSIGDRIVTNANATQVSPAVWTLGTIWNGHGTANKDMLLAGTYSESAQTFTFSSSGTSTLYVFDHDGGGAGASFGAIVLVGYTTVATTTGASTGLVGAAS